MPQPAASADSNFVDEIFISYAHIDNDSLKQGLEGWITKFHHALEIRVAQVRGQPPKVFRDPKLQGNDVFGDVLMARLRKAALMVSVLSPGYIQSEWCSRELDEFCTTLSAAGRLVLGDHKARVFKIVKTAVPLASTPEVFQALIGYEFFQLDPKGRPRELDEIYGPEAEREFWARLNDLAYDIAELLNVLENPPETSGKPFVYLAETTSDLDGDRDAIRRDLQRHGYTVLPDRTLPLKLADLEAFLASEVARCKISVHLAGPLYGVVPEGTDESLTAIQNRIAREAGKAGRLVRLVWIKSGDGIQEARQKSFVEQARTDPGLDEGADVLEKSIEELKTELYNRLKAAEIPPPEAAGPTVAGVTHVYLICVQGDQDALKPVADYLFQQGCEVALPLFDKDATDADLREDHEANLKSCDAVMIYYGQGSVAWQRAKMRELAGSAGLGRKAPFLAAGILLGPPQTDAKQQFRSNDVVVMRMPDTFTSAVLNDFLSRLRSGSKHT
jgi:hypothetical protein